MGLEIYVYKLNGLIESSELGKRNVIQLHKTDFPEQFDDLIDKGVYSYEYLYDFSVGLYSSYTLIEIN